MTQGESAFFDALVCFQGTLLLLSLSFNQISGLNFLMLALEILQLTKNFSRLTLLVFAVKCSRL